MKSYCELSNESTTITQSNEGSESILDINSSANIRPGLALYRQLEEVPHVVGALFLPEGQQSFQSRDIPMGFPDGKLYKYRFQAEYLFAPDFHVKEIEEEVLKVKERSKRINDKFQECMGGIMATIRQKVRDPSGLAEVCSNFDVWCNKLLDAYKDLDFKSRDSYVAVMQLAVNVMKLNSSNDKLAKFFQELLREQQEARGIFEKFLTVEPWETQIKSLKDATFKMNADTTAAQIASFLLSVQNGDLDTPSFHIDLSLFIHPKPGTAEMLDRFVRWAKGGNAKAYELQLMVAKAADVCIMSNRLRDSFLNYFKTLGVELFTLRGTDKILGESFCGHPLAATTILECLSASENLHMLQRFSMSDCYVDFDTLRALREIVTTTEISALKLSNLRPGLIPPDEPRTLKMAQRSADCGDVLRGNADCTCNFCFCCATVPDFQKTRIDLDKYMKEFSNKYGSIKDSYGDTCGELLSDIFQNMNQKREAGRIDVVDLTGTDLINLCGNVAEVNKALTALAEAKPTAVNLTRTGLLDTNICAISDLFFENPDLAHLAVTLTVSDSETLENLQNLVQNSPMLVSGGIEMGLPRKGLIAGQLEDKIVEKLHCCFPYSEVSVHQSQLQVQFPQKVCDRKDFQVFQKRIEQEMTEHLIMPMYRILSYRCTNNLNKLKHLHRASVDPAYRSAISPEADARKLELWSAFHKEVKSYTLIPGVYDQMLTQWQVDIPIKADRGPGKALTDPSVSVSLSKPATQPASQSAAEPPKPSSSSDAMTQRRSLGKFIRSSFLGGQRSTKTD